MACLSILRTALPLAIALTACGSSPTASPGSSSTAASPAVSTRAASAAASGGTGSAQASGSELKLGDVTFNTQGTRDISGKSTFDLEADSYYFGPTFLKGTPGEKVTLHIGNDSSAAHTFTAPALNIDEQLPQGKDADVQLTFPQSGTVYFFCRFHRQRGMNGELLVGDASPQPPASGAATGANSGGSPTGGAPAGGSGY